jgi:hypothetical protein
MNSHSSKKSQEDPAVKEFLDKIYSKSKTLKLQFEKSPATEDKEGTGEA